MDRGTISACSPAVNCLYSGKWRGGKGEGRGTGVMACGRGAPREGRCASKHGRGSVGTVHTAGMRHGRLVVLF